MAVITLRVVSFDVGLTNLGIWAGEFRAGRDTTASFPFSFEHWELLNLGTIELKEATESLHRELDRRPFLSDDFDWVLIENQIDDVVSPQGGSALYRVGRMKAVGAALHSYFLGRRLSKRDPSAGKITYVSSRGKLRVCQCKKSGTRVPARKSNHARNKAMVVAHVRKMLMDAVEAKEAEPELVSWFAKLRKKDDVADAFLQAAYWCIRKTRWRGLHSDLDDEEEEEEGEGEGEGEAGRGGGEEEEEVEGGGGGGGRSFAFTFS